MSILSTNLKHFYQRRSFWILGLFFGAIAYGIAGDISQAADMNRLGRFGIPAIWMLFVGPFVATLPIDVLTKPFSYCLPNHRKIPRKFLFSVGLFLSFLWSLTFIFFPELSFAQTILTCLSAFAGFTIFFWLGAWFVFNFRNWSIIFALFPFLMLSDLFSQLYGIRLNITLMLVHTIVQNPGLMILLGGIVNYLAWGYWGRPNLARQYCGTLWMGAFDSWNKTKILKFRQAKLAEKDKKKSNSMRISSGVEEFFVSRISHTGTGSLQQYIWGNLYKTFGVIISQHWQELIRVLMIILPILCVLCYIPSEGKNIIFIMPGIIVAQWNLWVHSSLLISSRRRQRFWSALILAIIIGIFFTILVVLLTTVTYLLENIMPVITCEGHPFVFKALDMKFIPVPLIMAPVTFALSLIFHKKPMLAMISFMIVFQILFLTTIIANFKIMNMTINFPFIIIISLLCSWAIFISVLRYISMKCCLVSQTK